MALGGFFGQVVAGIGNNEQYKQQHDLVQSEIEGKQARTAMEKMQMMAMSQKMQSQKELGQFIASQQNADKATVDDPQQSAQVYDKAANMALSHGDFEGAAQMSSLAKGKLTEAKEAQALVTQKIAMAKEDLATSAMDYAQNATPEAAKTLAMNAVRAGVNPTTIPAPGTPAFAAWATSQTQASMSGKERTTFVQKQQDMQAAREERWQVHKDNNDIRLAQMRQTAAIQEGNLQLRRSMAADRSERAPTEKEFDGKTYQWDPKGQIPGARDRGDKGWVQMGGPKQSVQQQATTNAVVGSAAEAMRGLRVISQMPPGQSVGAFAGLASGTVLESLSKVGTNTVTPQSMQMYQTASAGLGLELGRVLTLGGGRGVNQSQIHEFQNMTQVHPGDTEFAAMFKYANAADIVRNRLSTLPDSNDPKVLAHQRETEALLAKIPTPEQVLSAAGKHGQRSEVLKKYGNLEQAASNILQQETAPAAPAGIQNLLDKYK